MLKRVKLDVFRPSFRTITPMLLQPLIDAATHANDLIPVVRSLVQGLGFDSLTCGWSSAARPDRDSLLYVFTTMPDEWTALYDRSHFIEVDPRIHADEDSTALLVWSAEDLRDPRGKNRERNAFFDEAARYGICSGASLGWHDPEGNRVLIAYNSAKPRLVPEGLREVGDSLYAFGHAFHEIFMRAVIERDMPSRLRGVALTRREIEAMEYAARGLTLQDIGPKMGISPRTVRFHIDAATTKLGALKREEAIALAVKGGLIRVLR